jgi:hypothetical protein
MVHRSQECCDRLTGGSAVAYAADGTADRHPAPHRRPPSQRDCALTLPQDLHRCAGWASRGASSEPRAGSGQRPSSAGAGNGEDVVSPFAELVRWRGTASHPPAASRPGGIVAGGPGGVGFACLLLIGLDPLIDFLSVGAVVADGSLDEAGRDLEIACRPGGVAIVVAYGRANTRRLCLFPRAWPVGEPIRRSDPGRARDHGRHAQPGHRRPVPGRTCRCHRIPGPNGRGSRSNARWFLGQPKAVRIVRIRGRAHGSEHRPR